MMNDIRERLERDLRTTVSRFRTLDGRVAIEELAGAIGATCPFADEVDQIQASASREIGFATRELLLERVNRLSTALDRVNEGEYGTCAECDEPISLARLDALPEVQTCVRLPGPARAPRPAAPDSLRQWSSLVAKPTC